MTLKNLTVATATIKTPGGEFTVRGLSLNDVLYLVRKHRAAMSGLFAKLSSSDTDASLDNAAAFGGALIESAPDIAAEIIALAAGEPDAIENVKALGFPSQIEALERIGELTFSAEGGPKKVVETVIRVVTGATNLLSDLKT